MSPARLFSLFAVSSILAACLGVYSPDPQMRMDDPVLVERTFSLAYEGSKTSQETGVTSFCEGDVIRYYGVEERQVRESAVSFYGNSATVSLTLTSSEEKVIAVYGGTGVVPVSGDSFVLSQSNDQVPVQDGSFASAHTAVAKSAANAGKLTFRNVSRLIEFSLERDDVRRVLFFNNSGYVINSGSKECYVDVPYAFPGGSGVSYIPVDVRGKGTYYISFPSDVYMPCGFTMDLLDGDGKYLGSVRNNNPVSIDQNQIVSLGTLDSRVTDEDMIYYIPETTYDSSTGNIVVTVSCATRSGYYASVKSDPSNGRYITTLACSGAPDDTAINVYSDPDGTVRSIATVDALYDFSYHGDGSTMQVTKIEFSKPGQSPVTSEILPNPNYNRNFTPVDAGIYEGRMPDQVLTLYGFLSPAISLIGFLAPSGWFDVAFWAAEVGNSVLGNPIIGSALMLASFEMGCTALVAATAPFAYWIAVIGMVAFIADRVHDCIVTWQNSAIEQNLGSAVPITLGYKVLSETSVEIYCSSSSYVDAYIGVILADGLLINHNNHLDKRSSRTQPGSDYYSFTFSGLKAGKTYKYRAYLTHDDNTLLDYYKYGEVKEFTLYWDIDLGLSVKWASCNLGASNTWEMGKTYTLEKAMQAAEKLGDGWRVPTMDEADELIMYKTDYGHLEFNGMHACYITINDGQTLIFPIGGPKDPTTAHYWTTGESTSSSTPPNVRTFVYGRNGPSYDPGPYWASYGWLHASDYNEYYVRLVRDY